MQRRHIGGGSIVFLFRVFRRIRLGGGKGRLGFLGTARTGNAGLYLWLSTLDFLGYLELGISNLLRLFLGLQYINLALLNFRLLLTPRLLGCQTFANTILLTGLVQFFLKHLGLMFKSINRRLPRGHRLIKTRRFLGLIKVAFALFVLLLIAKIGVSLDQLFLFGAESFVNVFRLRQRVFMQFYLLFITPLIRLLSFLQCLALLF